MKKIFPLIAVLLLCTSVTSCKDNDDEETPVYINASWYGVDQVKGGSHYLFKYEAIAVKGKLAKLIVRSYDPNNGLQDIETIELSGTKKSGELDYLVPVFSDEFVKVELRFTVVNTEGDEWNSIKYLQVSNEDKPLAEVTLNLVEKPSVGKYNCITFANGSPEVLNTEVVSDESKQHVVIYRNSDLTDTNASKGIMAKASNVRFVKLNSFGYTNAKFNILNKTFQDSYNASQTVNNLKISVGDIILVGKIDEGTKKSTALGMLKVVKVPETNDKETDIYTFAVKYPM